MAMLALSYGAHVACEKPIALTYADAKEMFDYAREKDRVLFACQVVRYNEEYQVAKEFMDDGTLGKVYYSEFSLIRRRGVPKWGMFHRKDANGGGALCDLGVHLIDAALWVMGSPKFTAISGMASAEIAHNETANVQSKAQAFSTLLASGLHPLLAMQKSGISNDPISDYAMSKPYIEMIIGNPEKANVSNTDGKGEATIIEEDRFTGNNDTGGAV